MGLTGSREYGKEAVFYINGEKYTADSSLPATTSLNSFIRDHASLKGTKYMCYEGGCGACIVMITALHPVTKKKQSFAVNSCLFPVFACHGCEITTVEGIGNQKIGHHKVQKTLAAFSGTQCGYCSPGMVMNMYSLLQDGKDVTMADIENSFGGNICRCTGYRPILDAFKSLASDAPPHLKEKAQDIEDMLQDKMCLKNGESCCKLRGKGSEQCGLQLSTEIPPLHLQFQTKDWFKVDQISEIFSILAERPDKKYMLVGGNTATGVYSRDPDIEVFIDINSVTELKSHSVGSELLLGANISLTETMNLFYDLARSNSQFSYTKVIADHIDLIANVPVRNTGTLAGNLSIKHAHPEFPSDVFLCLETAGALITIVEKSGSEQSVSPENFLKVDMNQKVIKNIKLPSYDSSYYFRSYKIMPRAQNAHAYVNAGFLVQLDRTKAGHIVGKPRIVFGGINKDTIHATKTEEFLEDKNVYDKMVLLHALEILDSELKPDYTPPDATPEYRKQLAEGLFYKFVLSISPEDVSERFKSGGQLLKRPLSCGKQVFEDNQQYWPLGKAMPKLEALVQCSGEAEYVNDIPTTSRELHGAFVVTTVGSGTIQSIDPSEALSLPGVVAYYDAKDIPGNNVFTSATVGLVGDEEIFCSGTVKFNGQIVGIILATSHNTATQAAALVKIEYTSVKKPMIHLRDAAKSGDPNRVFVAAEMTPTDTSKKKNTKHTIKGSFHVGSQYHFSMETQTALCIPTEDGIDVYAPTQWPYLTQVAISEALKIPQHSINVNVRRVGGCYGCKITRNSQTTAAGALAAYLQKRPVRIHLPLQRTMESIGKRFDVAMDYEVGVDDQGNITYVEANTYHNNGSGSNDHSADDFLIQMASCYNNSTWKVTSYTVKTDIPAATWCRAPDSLEGIALAEQMMEHIAKTIGRNPVDIKIQNLSPSYEEVGNMIKYWKTKTEFEERKNRVEHFNKKNRWRKRGIAIVTMRYLLKFYMNFHAAVTIYAGDGTVSVAIGGVECGQGINTKVAQVAASALGISVDLVNIRPTTSFTSPNNYATGGSQTSECCAYATQRACEILKQRLAPIRRKMTNPTWQELITQANAEFVDLSASFMMYQGMEEKLDQYPIYGVTVGEVEVDMLTGQYEVLRVDILEDVGISMNPDIDVGQIEGAFVMGLGYWLTEYIVYDEETGKVLTNRTWNYKPPGAKDIPIEFNIELKKKAPNPLGVLRSKAVGEPPLCMSIVTFFALREAVLSARKDAGSTDNWVDIAPPATPEKILLAAMTDYKQFDL
ncbi:indole-3-acetaldehyde oxidase-like [Schistocerca piceifrons]|uniref:indole-3-acetaldehyde oxidase-like n=1 Tax=Schistocerca piceifrons TaxID=274613 RepID=UPI001F5E4D26|nr:indole-3-acetaldehyde oxidase-like [Schistocerca piceifrons]